MKRTARQSEDLNGLDHAVGRRLRALRRTKNLSLEVLAERAKCRLVFLSQVERGLSLPSLRVLATLADALDTGIATLIDAQIPPANDDRIVTRDAGWHPATRRRKTGVDAESRRQFSLCRPPAAPFLQPAAKRAHPLSLANALTAWRLKKPPISERIGG
jgi:transcriptional regulator with XRE-family HTH domain